MEYLKTKKQRRIVVPKKKKNKKVYFGMDVQDAIIRYNDSNNDDSDSQPVVTKPTNNIQEQKQVDNLKDKFDELFA